MVDDLFVVMRGEVGAAVGEHAVAQNLAQVLTAEVTYDMTTDTGDAAMLVRR